MLNTEKLDQYYAMAYSAETHKNVGPVLLELDDFLKKTKIQPTQAVNYFYAAVIFSYLAGNAENAEHFASNFDLYMTLRRLSSLDTWSFAMQAHEQNPRHFLFKSQPAYLTEVIQKNCAVMIDAAMFKSESPSIAAPSPASTGATSVELPSVASSTDADTPAEDERPTRARRLAMTKPDVEILQEFQASLADDDRPVRRSRKIQVMAAPGYLAPRLESPGVTAPPTEDERSCHAMPAAMVFGGDLILQGGKVMAPSYLAPRLDY